jgi:hypothetical protein
MTETPAESPQRQDEQKQFKHIYFGGRHQQFEYMTICRKSLLEGIAFHEIIYKSSKDGFDVKMLNTKSDGRSADEEHTINGLSFDEKYPAELIVTVENGCLRLQDSNNEDYPKKSDLIDIIPLGEILMIRFDAISGAIGSTDMHSILARSMNDLEAKK